MSNQEKKGNPNNDSFNIKVGDTIIYTGLTKECIIIDKCTMNDYPRMSSERVGTFPENLAYKGDETNLRALGLPEHVIKNVVEGRFRSPLILFTETITKERQNEIIDLYVPKNHNK